MAPTHEIRAIEARVAPRPHPLRAIVLGDLMVDAVLAPAVLLQRGTDVPGRVFLRQGGSAATTARWLGRLGASATLISAVGRDGPGRALVALLAAEGVRVHAQRLATPTGRIGVLVEPGGERSFVADRGAADGLSPDYLRASWFRASDALHLPAYSLLGEPLGRAARSAIRIAHERGMIVSLDLASSAPLLALGRASAIAAVREVKPALLFCTAAEAEALVGGTSLDDLFLLAPTIVVKRGARGATVMAQDGEPSLRFEVATRALEVADSTGAGDAFDAGFLVAWSHARAQGVSISTALRRGALGGHKAAARQLLAARPELDLG